MGFLIIVFYFYFLKGPGTAKIGHKEKIIFGPILYFYFSTPKKIEKI